MDKHYICITQYFEQNFDLASIQALPITDKFRLIHYIKLVGEVAATKDIEAIKSSPYFEMDKTFHLFISLIASEVSEQVITEVMEAYVYQFNDSAVFRAKLLILGSGALMIKKGIDRESILTYLVSLLGNEFLKNNFERIYAERDQLDLTGENVIKINYKDFDYTYRKLKYDLLAFLKMSKERGKDEIREIVYKKYDNKELRFFFKLLDLENKDISDYLYGKLFVEGTKMDRFLLVAVKAILEDKPIIETHYLLNAIIGKYTRFEKPYEEVIEEIKQRESEILAL